MEARSRMAGNPKIIVLSEQFRGQSFELTEGKYTVGRGEDCGICLPDPTISAHHCSLERTGDGTYQLVDAGSTNGTRVNGVRVKQQNMVNSDIIQVGAIEMLFDSEAKSGAESASTQTGINLQTSAGTTMVNSVPNFSPFNDHADVEGGKSGLGSMVVVGLIGLLVVVALVVLAMVVIGLFGTA
ncbi:MAG: FHA domain-containing protein [Lentisphaeria bacterium]|nr:FHA domain-containing protein [Lentisphaeria bacterium]